MTAAVFLIFGHAIGFFGLLALWAGTQLAIFVGGLVLLAFALVTLAMFWPIVAAQERS